MSAKRAKAARKREREQNGGLTKKEWARHRSDTEYRLTIAHRREASEEDVELTPEQIKQLQECMSLMGAASS